MWLCVCLVPLAVLMSSQAVLNFAPLISQLCFSSSKNGSFCVSVVCLNSGCVCVLSGGSISVSQPHFWDMM